MDPDACFSQLFDAIVGTDDDAAKQCAEDLSAWLVAGLYPGGDKLSRSSIKAFLAFVLSE